MVVQIYIHIGNQSQALRMIIENQNASYRFAARVSWDWSRNNGENSFSR